MECTKYYMKELKKEFFVQSTILAMFVQEIADC